MTVSLYTFVDLYDRALNGVSHLLDKGMEYCAGQGIGEREMLSWRVIEDMHPLGFQVMVVINFSSLWPARVAGVPAPEPVSPDLDVGQFKHAIVRAKDFLVSLKPEHFAGRDDVPLTFRITDTMEPTMPAAQWLTVFATTNIYFHLSTAYNILRANAVPIGKADLFAGRI